MEPLTRCAPPAVHTSYNHPVVLSPEEMMREAIALARDAATAGEVPIGCVVELDGKLIGRGANRTLRDHDATAHAEILALREAGAAFGDFRLEGARLAVTVEPCLMCVGAILIARVAEVYFGIPEPKFGAVDSRFVLRGHPRLRRTRFIGGYFSEEIAAMMREFFEHLREQEQVENL